jgi:CubicO group peptidase (beta-lactamase class C family)
VLDVFEPAAGAAGRAAFHGGSLSPAGQSRWPLPFFERVVGSVAELSGGFDFVDLDRRGGTCWLTVRSRRQGALRTLRVRIDRDDPARIFDISASPMPAPYSGPLPQGPIAPSELPAWIERRLRFSAMRDEFSGACRVLAPNGEVAYEAAFGMAGRGPDVPNLPSTRFHLGSADKSFTALLVALLVAEERIGFDTTLAEILPDWPDLSYAEACTMRHLLSHSAGLGMLFDRPGYDKRKPHERMEELAPAFAAELPAFRPGAGAAYSNEGFVVLGAVIERVTGESWYDLLARHIYSPAGMKRSGHFLTERLPDDAAQGMRYAMDDHLGLEPRQSNRDFLGYRGNSCGGGYSTVADMTSYLRALRAGEIVPRELAAEMIAPQPQGLRRYGLGFEVETVAAGRTAVGHGGGGPHSGIDRKSAIIWETGWAYSLLGNYDAPFAGTIASDIEQLLAAVA